MKGLISIPRIQDLELAYQRLNYKISCEDLALFSQWSRFDARLGEIWVDWVLKNWRTLNPVLFHIELEKHPWPNAASVMLEFVSLRVGQEESKLFQKWKETVNLGINPANFEQFFIGQRSIGGKEMFLDAQFPLNQYLKWGYLGREILFNKEASLSGKTHTYSSSTRLGILKNLFRSQSRVTIHEYWVAIGRCISRRQAERDMLQLSDVFVKGNTRGRFYQKGRGS